MPRNHLMFNQHKQILINTKFTHIPFPPSLTSNASPNLIFQLCIIQFTNIVDSNYIEQLSTIYKDQYIVENTELVKWKDNSGQAKIRLIMQFMLSYHNYQVKGGMLPIILMILFFLLLIIYMLRKASQAFSTSSCKYFLDDKYFNFTLMTYSRTGSLCEIEKIFSETEVTYTHLRSRFTKDWEKRKSLTLDISAEKIPKDQLSLLTQRLAQSGIKLIEADPIKVPWFPTKTTDLDKMGEILLDVPDKVGNDHMQFCDMEYRKRRDYIADVGRKYRIGDQIPEIDYTPQENQLWKKIFGELSALQKKVMSSKYLRNIQDLSKELRFSQGIPQMKQLNSYLKSKTGFTIKPTVGILSQREFLNAFAFKTFCCTQYIRNDPEYTPEPDIVHEILGHMPMFADPGVASLSHEIGLLSLGATDEQIAMLGTLFHFTLQFGACLEGKERLGYGAGIASSRSEILNFLSDKCKFISLNPERDCKASYPIQTVQQTYRVTESFEAALQQLQQFGESICKPIQTVFNSETQQIEYNRCIQAIDFEEKYLAL